MLEPFPGLGGNLPYPATFEQLGVHQVRAHQSHADAVLFRDLNLMAQRFMETDGTKLTGAVILKGIEGKKGL